MSKVKDDIIDLRRRVFDLEWKIICRHERASWGIDERTATSYIKTCDRCGKVLDSGSLSHKLRDELKYAERVV